MLSSQVLLINISRLFFQNFPAIHKNLLDLFKNISNFPAGLTSSVDFRKIVLLIVGKGFFANYSSQQIISVLALLIDPRNLPAIKLRKRLLLASSHTQTKKPSAEYSSFEFDSLKLLSDMIAFLGPSFSASWVQNNRQFYESFTQYGGSCFFASASMEVRYTVAHCTKTFIPFFLKQSSANYSLLLKLKNRILPLNRPEVYGALIQILDLLGTCLKDSKSILSCFAVQLKDAQFLSNSETFQNISSPLSLISSLLKLISTTLHCFKDDDSLKKGLKELLDQNFSKILSELENFSEKFASYIHQIGLIPPTFSPIPNIDPFIFIFQYYDIPTLYNLLFLSKGDSATKHISQFLSLPNVFEEIFVSDLTPQFFIENPPVLIAFDVYQELKIENEFIYDGSTMKKDYELPPAQISLPSFDGSSVINYPKNRKHGRHCVLGTGCHLVEEKCVIECQNWWANKKFLFLYANYLDELNPKVYRIKGTHLKIIQPSTYDHELEMLSDDQFDDSGYESDSEDDFHQ